MELIGTGLRFAQDVFAGIRGISVGDGKEKLDRILNDCANTADSANTQLSSPPIISNGRSQDLESSPEISQKESSLAKRVARNFDREFKRGGMLRIKEGVSQCYQQASRSFDYFAAEYCYILDQISCGMDEAFWGKFRKPQQDEFWLKSNRVARTLSLFSGGNLNPAQTMQRWDGVKSLALRELLSLQH